MACSSIVSGGRIVWRFARDCYETQTIRQKYGRRVIIHFMNEAGRVTRII